MLPVITLNNIQEFFKSSKGRVFLIVAAILVIGFLITLVSILSQSARQKKIIAPSPTPTPLVEPVGRPPQVTSKTILEYVGAAIPLPSHAQIYRILPKPDITSQEVARELAKALGFGQEPRTLPSGMMVWSTPPQLLTINPEKSVLKFEHSLTDPGINTGKLPRVDEAKKVAQEFLVKLKISERLDFNDPQISYHTKPSLHELEAATPETAESILFSFQHRVSETPIFPTNPASQIVTVLVGRGNKIIRAQVALFSFTYIPQQSTSIPTFQIALEELHSGRGFVYLSVDFEEGEFGQERQPSQFQKLTLSSSYFNYFMSERGLLLPALIFKGSGIVSGRTHEAVTVILPLASVD